MTFPGAQVCGDGGRDALVDVVEGKAEEVGAVHALTTEEESTNKT